MASIAFYRPAIGLLSVVLSAFYRPAIALLSACYRVCVQPPYTPMAQERALEGGAAPKQGSKKGLNNGQE